MPNQAQLLVKQGIALTWCPASSAEGPCSSRPGCAWIICSISSCILLASCRKQKVPSLTRLPLCIRPSHLCPAAFITALLRIAAHTMQVHWLAIGEVKGLTVWKKGWWHTRISSSRLAMTFMSAAASCGSLMSIAATSTPLSSPNRLCSCNSLAETALTCMQPIHPPRGSNNDTYGQMLSGTLCPHQQHQVRGVYCIWLDSACLGCDIG